MFEYVLDMQIEVTGDTQEEVTRKVTMVCEILDVLGFKYEHEVEEGSL